MSDAPLYEIDVPAFWKDPYPDLKAMRAEAPIARVPQLGATLFTRRDDIFENEKKIDIFSSYQPEGLMSVLMGENMMRKDGAAHQAERRIVFPALSPRTVRNVWVPLFEDSAERILEELAPRGRGDLVRDYAMPVSAEALKVITGLTNMHFAEMDRVSQGMIDGCANYVGDPDIEANCHDCTASIDRHIDEMVPVLKETPNSSVLSVQLAAGLAMESVRANVKLVISGGQNEPRDAIAGAVWALLEHPDQLAMIARGEATWLQAFEEYARWNSPIGMSPRRVARRATVDGVTFEPEDRVFFMFGSGNRDERVFEAPERFDITRNTRLSITFGSGPHFCAGAAASQALIADVALPKLFAKLKGLRLDGEVPFGGWAFRGPFALPCAWEAG